MLKVEIPSFETYKIGTRPAVLTSLKQILEYYDIDFNQKIFFNGEAEVSKLLGGDYNDKRGGDLDTDVGYDNKIFVELERELGDYNNELDNNTQNGMIPCVWHDPITGSKITPKFSTRIYRVTVNKYMKDRVTAERYYTNIRSKTLGTHLNSLFSVDTHFPITYPIMDCYQTIFERLKNAGQLPADKEYLDWMFDCSTVPAGILRNIIGNNPVFVFKQCIDEVGINIDNPNKAMVDKGAYIGKFEVSFSYWFYWSEQVNWILEYPIQVYQQPTLPIYIPEVFNVNVEPYATRRFYESAVAQKIFNTNVQQTPYYHILPTADNWRPDPEYWVSPQLQVVINVEDVQEQVLLNIKEIQGFEWNPKILNYIMKYHTKVTDRHSNPMQFKVWSNDIQVLEEQIKLLDNGDLILTRPPAMGNIYRITFNFDYALRLYNEECIEDILQDPDWGKWIINILFPQWEWNTDFGNGGEADWWEIHNGIDVGDGDQVDFFMPYGTLGFWIVAHNKETINTYKSLIEREIIDGSDYYRDRSGQAS